MERVFRARGLAPYISKAANEFIASCDLGIEGGYVERALRLTATLKPDCTDEQRARQADSIKAALEAQGWRQVEVTPEDKPA